MDTHDTHELRSLLARLMSLLTLGLLSGVMLASCSGSSRRTSREAATKLPGADATLGSPSAEDTEVSALKLSYAVAFRGVLWTMTVRANGAVAVASGTGEEELSRVAEPVVRWGRPILEDAISQVSSLDEPQNPMVPFDFSKCEILVRANGELRRKTLFLGANYKGAEHYPADFQRIWRSVQLVLPEGERKDCPWQRGPIYLREKEGWKFIQIP